MANPFFKMTAKATVDVVKAMQASEKAEMRYLFRVGGYARKTARRLLPKRKTKYGKPGEPPFSKTGSMKNGIAFKVLRNERSVIIGPERDQGKKNSLVLHELGGTVQGDAGYVLVPNREIRKSEVRRDKPVLESKVRAHSRVFLPAGTRKYQPRPYMAPALDTTLKQDQKKFWLGVRT